jgi:hypothetical protein
MRTAARDREVQRPGPSTAHTENPHTENPHTENPHSENRFGNHVVLFLPRVPA